MILRLSVALLGLAAVVAGCGGGDGRVAVPKVAGLVPDEAAARICAAGLTPLAEVVPLGGAPGVHGITMGPVDRGGAVDILVEPPSAPIVELFAIGTVPRDGARVLPGSRVDVRLAGFPEPQPPDVLAVLMSCDRDRQARSSDRRSGHPVRQWRIGGSNP